MCPEGAGAGGGGGGGVGAVVGWGWWGSWRRWLGGDGVGRGYLPLSVLNTVT